MSGYDKIIVKCPTCGWDHSVRTRSGGCEMVNYDLDSCPVKDEERKAKFLAAVQGANQGAPFLCLRCKTTYEIDIQNRKTVKLGQTLSKEAQMQQEIDRLRKRCLQLQDALEDMTWQFAIHIERGNGEKILHDSGLSSLELAFSVLGWDEDPMPEAKAIEKMKEPVEGLKRE